MFQLYRFLNLKKFKLFNLLQIEKLYTLYILKHKMSDIHSIRPMGVYGVISDYTVYVELVLPPPSILF